MTHSSVSTISSDRASGYLQQLCKHFGHKIETRFTPEEGEIIFPFGRCDLTAVDRDLTMKAQAESEEDLKKLENVIASHLERFAFKEELKISWT
ncbi:DUF2218 domain-containing protein [uncultured Cohaesibacter sp.]|uniref:DUF2218 domain-containing protein n=1 Tax=uncultured Cohaesibacter sp. TaxID=1002546 RepID=UPI0029C7F31C|nr:DUF2218 domain-containing protein [uncultured Cohaesibacter sp.]